MRNKLFTSTFILAAALSSTPGALAETGIRVDQGEIMVSHHEIGEGVTETKSCTVGYVARNYAITAGHCAEDGSTVFNNKGDEIGVFSTSYKKAQDRDIGYVYFLPNVEKGSNKYSGEAIADLDSLRIGGSVKAYGMASDRVREGKAVGASGAAIITDQAASGINGDSGGPVWTDKGLIGIYSSTYVFKDKAYTGGFTSIEDVVGLDVWDKRMIELAHRNKIGQPLNVVKYEELSNSFDHSSFDARFPWLANTYRKIILAGKNFKEKSLHRLERVFSLW